jgi:phage terminase large subunit
MFLSAHQIEEIESNKHNENWWRVYGLGLTGQLEGTIFSNWSYGEFDNSLPFGYGLDFGSRDPDAMVKCAIDFEKQTIYLDEILYQNGLNTNDLGKLINSRIDKDKLIIADSAATRTIQDLKHIGLNITGVSKDPVIDSIKQLSNFKLIITETSYNIVRELQNYVWLDKKGEIPIDTFNHLIDAFRYIAMTFIKAKTKHSTGHKLAHYSPIYHR